MIARRVMPKVLGRALLLCSLVVAPSCSEEEPLGQATQLTLDQCVGKNAACGALTIAPYQPSELRTCSPAHGEALEVVEAFEFRKNICPAADAYCRAEVLRVIEDGPTSWVLLDVTGTIIDGLWLLQGALDPVAGSWGVRAYGKVSPEVSPLGRPWRSSGDFAIGREAEPVIVYGQPAGPGGVPQPSQLQRAGMSEWGPWGSGSTGNQPTTVHFSLRAQTGTLLRGLAGPAVSAMPDGSFALVGVGAARDGNDLLRSSLVITRLAVPSEGPSLLWNVKLPVANHADPFMEQAEVVVNAAGHITVGTVEDVLQLSDGGQVRWARKRSETPPSGGGTSLDDLGHGARTLAADDAGNVVLFSYLPGPDSTYQPRVLTSLDLNGAARFSYGFEGVLEGLVVERGSGTILMLEQVDRMRSNLVEIAADGTSCQRRQLSKKLKQGRLMLAPGTSGGFVAHDPDDGRSTIGFLREPTQ